MQQLFPYFRALFMYQRQGFRTYFLILTVVLGKSAVNFGSARLYTSSKPVFAFYFRLIIHFLCSFYRTTPGTGQVNSCFCTTTNTTLLANTKSKHIWRNMKIICLLLTAHFSLKTNKRHIKPSHALYSYLSDTLDSRLRTRRTAVGAAETGIR